MIFIFFAIFENGHSDIEWLYFYELVNCAECASGAHVAKFSFSKNHRDLKN